MINSWHVYILNTFSCILELFYFILSSPGLWTCFAAGQPRRGILARLQARHCNLWYPVSVRTLGGHDVRWRKQGSWWMSGKSNICNSTMLVINKCQQTCLFYSTIYSIMIWSATINVRSVQRGQTGWTVFNTSKKTSQKPASDERRWMLHPINCLLMSNIRL